MMDYGENKLFNYLIKIAILFIPFSAIPFGYSWFGELSTELSFYPILILITVFSFNLIHYNKIHIRFDFVTIAIFAFFSWTICSGLLNLVTIIYSQYKQRTGFEKLFLQEIVLIFYILFYLILRQYIEKNFTTQKMTKIKKYIKIGYYLNLFVAVIEILNNLIFMGSFNYIFEGLVDVIYPGTYYGRVRGLGFEASVFSMALSFAAPFVFEDLLKKNKFIEDLKSYGLLLITVIVAILSYSRTSVIILCQIFFILYYKQKMYSFRNKIAVIPIMILFIVSFVTIANGYVAQISDRGDYFSGLFSLLDIQGNASNLARFGLQYAAIQIGLDNPIIGVGLGQFGFHYVDQLPGFAWLSPDILSWADEGNQSWPSVFNIYLRLFCETGIIGLILYLLIFISAFHQIRSMNSAKDKLILKLSLAGIFLSGFNWDSFRTTSIWVILAIIGSLSKINMRRKN